MYDKKDPCARHWKTTDLKRNEKKRGSLRKRDMKEKTNQQLKTSESSSLNLYVRAQKQFIYNISELPEGLCCAVLKKKLYGGKMSYHTKLLEFALFREYCWKVPKDLRAS